MVKKILSGHALTEFLKTVRGDVTWEEQFGYIFMCIKETTKITLSTGRYNPPV